MAINSSAAPALTKVSVVITTYNFQDFVREAIDSVLMQETDFDYELILLDDCSTDDTVKILSEYQAAHPTKVSLVLSDVNKCDNAMFMAAIADSRSPYFVMLDGDDYWTSSRKLQRQVDYLDSHPECTICFHNSLMTWLGAEKVAVESNPPGQKEISTLDDLIESCFITTCSAMFRRSAIDRIPSWYVGESCADWALFFLAAEHGTVGYLPDVMAVYRQHSGGYWTGRSIVEQLGRLILLYERMLAHLPEQYRDQVSTMLARRCYDLAIECDLSGDAEAVGPVLEKCRAAQPDTRKSRWLLRCAPGSRALLRFSQDHPAAVRLEIEHASTDLAFDIQLERAHLKLKAGHSYTIRFKAKADITRRLAIGVSQAHEPWHGLGLYRIVELGTQWQLFEESFIASASDHNARFHFDAGGNDVALDFSDFTIRNEKDNDLDYFVLSPADGGPVASPASGEYHGWVFRAEGANAARLTFLTRETLRLQIEHIGSSNPYDLQLGRPHYRIGSGHRYRLEFRARADATRRLSAGVGMAHAPWNDLGLYQTFDLQKEWRSHEAEFEASAEEGNARILFDAGDSDVSLELGSVVLRHLPDGVIVEPGFFAPREEEGAFDPLDEPPVPAPGTVQFGSLRRVKPLSRERGFDRGLPIDRYYIRRFLAQNASWIQGRVLEIGGNSYTREFGASRVTQSDVMHVSEGDPHATIIADLTSAPQIPSDTFNCVVLTQTLQLIYDVRSAIKTVHRILKPGGVLLATFPGISQTYDHDWKNDWYWCFTSLSARRLIDESFPRDGVQIQSFGNVLAAISFLHGLATEELDPRELAHFESGYEVIIAVKATKARWA